jgi:short-subunit dehydrogenase
MLKNNKIKPKTCQKTLEGRWVVITGATSGIGYHTARLYASKNANLICINRNEDRSKTLCEELKKEFGTECRYFIADFAHLSDVRKAGEFIANLDMDIDVVIHNAGVFLTHKTFTKDHIEQVFQVNYLSSFIINYMIKDKLIAQDHARIIYVNSEGHRFAIEGLKLDDLKWTKRRYSGLRSYGAAKTAQLLSMIKFVELFSGTGVTINAMHPGDVKTNMGENNGNIYRFFKHTFVNPSAKSPELSAESLYYLGASDDLKDITGKFFNFTTEEIPAPHALDKDMAEELWTESLKMVNLSF